MRNLFEENPKLAFGLLAGGVAAALGLSFLLKMQQNAPLERLRETEDGARQAAETDRLKEIRQIEYKDPDQALKLVEAVLQSPANPGEAAVAREKHANVLQLCFHNRLKAGQLEEARGFMERLAKTYPDSHFVMGVQRAWADQKKRTCREHVRAGRFAEAKAILQELAGNNWLFGDSQFLQEYQRGLTEAWKKTGANELAEFDNVLEAASVLAGLNFNSIVAAALFDSALPGARLLELAEREHSGPARYRAIPFYQAAGRRLNSGGKPWRGADADLTYPQREVEKRNVEAKLSTVLLGLADDLAKGSKPLITTHTAEEVCRDGAAQLQNQPLQVPLWRRLIALQEARLHDISKPALAYPLDRLASAAKLADKQYNDLNQALRESGHLAEEILRRSGASLWRCLVTDTNFNPWPLVSADVKAEFEARRKKGEREDYLQQSLGSRGQDPAFHTPLDELKPARQHLCEINARRGLFVYAVQPEECVTWLRRALADNTEAGLRGSLNTAVTTAILNCREPSKFKAFYELTGFFVSDIGLENLAPSQRGQFKTALDAAANGLASLERAKAIFLWSIQAEAYANEAEGPKARDAAINGAFELVGGLTPQKVGAENLSPSGLNGLSVLSVDNSTEYHLLVFYRGPETFVLASRPYRKVSAVLKNGAYEIAVIAPSGAIQPYRGAVTLQSAWQKSNYRVETSSGPSARSSPAVWQCRLGDYQLGRQRRRRLVAVDARTGAVSLRK